MPLRLFNRTWRVSRAGPPTCQAPEEIAERYLAYSHIERWADLRNYQKHADALGRKLFTDDEVQAARTAVDEVVTRWGPMMRKGNGWAAPLFPAAKSIYFSQLVELAGLGHMRPFYRLGSHHVHAGPRDTWAERDG